MTDITFITSNNAKLAHARYLCRNYQVNILHYKKFFYGIGYEEPRVLNREQLLSESFENAKLRWKKNVTKRDNRLFFIEDTSVKIDSLSNQENEVPGVDVKYWMLTTSFRELDQELRKRGNNRNCSVTSHVMLFLTEELKNRLSVDEDYMTFKSTAYGYVTEKEYPLETQILYPWLDNNTFNKWFIPEGHSLPVSMLDISEADSGDFRKGAFEQMLSFLEDNGAIKNKQHKGVQLQIQFNDSFIICGKTCAGKTTIGKYLVDEYGYYHIEASEFMTHKLLETHGTKTNVDKHKFAAEVLKVEPLFVVNSLIDYLQEHEIYDKFVITGFRTQNEIESFLTRFPSERLKLIYINSGFEERYRRWVLRQRDVDSYTKERFIEIDTVQEEMGIGTLATMHGVLQFDNNIEGTSLFYKKFRCNYMRHNKIESKRLEEKPLASINISLEKAVLLTLAIEYDKDMSKSFTTTEIAHLTNKYFKEIERNKNNISRYFNQSYYVYYEVKYVNHKNRYKISPIGYSEAIKLYESIPQMYNTEHIHPV